MDEVGRKGRVEADVDGGEAREEVVVIFYRNNAFFGGGVIIIVVTEITTAADTFGEVSGVEDGGVANDFGEAIGRFKNDELVEIVVFEFGDAKFGGDFGLIIHMTP